MGPRISSLDDRIYLSLKIRTLVRQHRDLERRQEATTAHWPPVWWAHHQHKDIRRWISGNISTVLSASRPKKTVGSNSFLCLESDMFSTAKSPLKLHYDNIKKEQQAKTNKLLNPIFIESFQNRTTRISTAHSEKKGVGFIFLHQSFIFWSNVEISVDSLATPGPHLFFLFCLLAIVFGTDRILQSCRVNNGKPGRGCIGKKENLFSIYLLARCAFWRRHCASTPTK